MEFWYASAYSFVDCYFLPRYIHVFDNVVLFNLDFPGSDASLCPWYPEKCDSHCKSIGCKEGYCDANTWWFLCKCRFCSKREFQGITYGCMVMGIGVLLGNFRSVLICAFGCAFEDRWFLMQRLFF